MKKQAKLLRKPRIRIVLSNAPAKEAELVSRMLLEERLIACANLLPGVQSLYWWKDKICNEAETIMVLKTSEKNVPALLKRLRELHSYDVPEFLVLSPEAGSTAYVEWVQKESKTSRAQ